MEETQNVVYLWEILPGLCFSFFPLIIKWFREDPTQVFQKIPFMQT